MASDKRDQLYTSLIGSGKVSEDEIGSIDEFKNALKDEQSTREFYRNLSASGLFDEDEIGNEDDFFESVSNDFAQPSAPNVVQRSIQQRTDPYSYVSQANRVKDDVEKRRSEPLTPSDIARMNQSMNTMRRSVDAGMRRFDRKTRNLEKRQGLSVPKRINLGETNNLREGEQHINPETGELEKSYITSSGEEYDSKTMAEQEQQQLDEQARYRQWRKDHPKEAMILDIDEQTAKLEKSLGNQEIEWVDADGRIHYKGGRVSDEAVNDVEVAMQDLKDARTRIERSGQLEASSDFLGGIGLPFTKDWFNNWKNFGYGVWDTLQNPSFYSFGMSDLKKAGTYVRIKNKMEKGEALTDQETAVALAGMALSHAQQIAEVPHGYTAGATTTEMAPFMLQMYANPASGVGRAFARQAVRKFGRDGIKAVSARAGARILGNIAEGTALANTLQAPGTIANIMQRYTGDSFEYGDNGKLRIGHYEKLPDSDTSVFVEGGKGLARSIWEGEASMIIENFTELGFGGNINKFLGKVANSGVGQKMGLGYLSDLVSKIGATPFARNMKHFMERTHWDGMIEEPLEEEYGIILNSLLTGDNQIRDLWDSEQQIDIFAGTMWFGGMMAAMNTAAYPYYRHKVKQQLNQADIFGQGAFGEEWSVIKDGIDEMSDKDVASYLYDVKGNDAYSNEQKAALFAYVSRLKQYQGASTSDMLMRMEGNLSQEETDMRNAYDRGAELTEPKDMNEAKMMMDVQHDRLSAIASDMIVEEFENNPLGALQGIINSEYWTDEEKQVAMNYVNARMTYEGMMDRIDDDIDSQIAFSDAMIDKKVNRDNPGMVIPATLTDDRQVSIISGSVIMLEDGTGVDRQASIEANGGDGMILTVDENGKVEAHSLEDFRKVDEAIPVQQMKDESAANIRQVAEQAASNNINGVLSFAQGDRYTILDEQGQEHSIQVFEDQGDGTVAVFLDDNPQVQVMAKDQLQAMSDAYRQEQMLQEQDEATVAQQYTEQEPAEQEEQLAKEEPTALSKIPVKMGADGKPVMKRSGKPELEWHKASVEDAAAALIETAGGNMLVARDTASDMVNVARGKLEKIRKQKPKGDDPIEIAESRQEIKRQEQEQEDIVKQWQNVGQEIQRRMQAESAARQEAIEAAKSEEQRQREAEEARKQKERQDEIDRQRIREQIERDKERRNREYAPLVEARKELADDEEALAILNDTEPRSLEEFVSSLIRPHSMLWQDASNSELGLQSELGLKRNDMQRMMTLLGTKESGAKPFGKVVLDIYEGLTDAMKEQYTDEDVRRALLDLFNEGSSTRMMHLTEENRITEAREVARENERRADEYEMEAWAEAYHLTPEERETFDEWMQQPPTEPEQEIINQIIAENEQNRNVQRVDQQFVTGTGTTGVEGSQDQVQGETETTGNGNVEATVAQGTEAAAGESAVSGDEVHGRAQDRQALAVLFDQIGASPVLAERMSDYDVEQLTALVEDWEIANDEYGQTIEENKDALKSKSKETREAAQKAIDDAQEQANAVFVPIEEYVEGLNVKYGIESEKPFEGAIPTPKIDKPRYDANRKALVEAYRSGDPAAITAAAQAVQQYVDEGLDAGEDHTEIFDIAEDYNGNDPEKLADQYIIRTFWDRYLDDDADQEYIKTGLKPGMHSDMLTVFEKKNSALDNTTDTGKTSNRGKRNDTATPQSTVSESKDKNNSGNIQENLGKTSSAEEISSEEAKVDTNPSDAQKEAGNYQKGHINIDGYDITIENPKGSVRRGTDASGKPWETEMHNTYGYIRGTEGVDGDHIDVFLSDNPTSGSVFVVDQVNPTTGEFDEHKVMYGFASEEEAQQAYLSNYNKGWKGLGKITEVSREDFKKWVESSHRKTKPFAEYKSVKAATKSQPTVKKTKEHKRLVSDDKMEELRKQLLAKMNNTNVGIDPERMLLGAMYAVGKIERGFTKFADYAQEMVNDLGDMIRPYLKSFYNAVRDMPEAQEYAAEMDDYDTVQKFDVFNFDKQGTSTVFEKAEQVSKEQKVKRDAKKVKKEQPDLFAGSLFDAELMPQPAEQETKQEPAAQGEPKYRLLTEADVDNDNPVVYYKGEPSRIMLITRTGEQTSATTFSKPRITSVMLTNGKSVKLEDLMVEDENADKEKSKPKTPWWNDPNRPQGIDPSDYHTYMTDEARKYFASHPAFGDWKRKDIAFVTAAVWDGVVIPYEALKDLPEIVAAEKNVKDATANGVLQISDDERELHAQHLLDAEHGSAIFENGKIKKVNGVEDFSGPVRQERKAIIIIGYPAAGKSSVYANRLSNEHGARIIDSDVVKPWLDGFDGGNGAGYVQNASFEVAERAIDIAVGKGDNIILPRIGGNSVIMLSAALKLAGYDVQLYFNDVATVTSVDRATSRFAETGRYLSLQYLTSKDGVPSKNFSNFALKTLGDYVKELSEGKVQELRGRIARLLESETIDGKRLWQSLATDQGGYRTLDEYVSVFLEPRGTGVTARTSDLIFSYSEWKSNDVAFGEKPKEIWNSKSGKPMPNKEEKDNDARNLQQVGEENRRGSDRVSSRESSVSGSANNSGLESDIQERRDERQGDTGVSESNEAISGSSAGQLRPVQGLTQQQPAQPKQAPKHNNKRNNSGERGMDYAPTSPKARFNANVEAIKMMRELIDQGIEAPTKDQMEVLRQYSGWGGLGTFFNDESSAENKILRDLLDDEEYNAATLSIKTAYYTPAYIIDSLWDIAKAMGFKGGNVLEGSAGIGNIIQQMPKDMSRQSDIEAVEIDKISGNILKLLYPDAKVHIQGFQDTVIRNGSVDLAITNVPFAADLSVIDKVDKDLSRRFRTLHDFCIAKNIRKLKEGGIGIFITTSGTMDKSTDLRAWIADEGQADVVGAFRMNNETFGGTKVTSDIIVVRKRVGGKPSEYSIDVSKASPIRVGTYKDKLGDDHQTTMVVNDYFKEHPEMMAGEMAFAYEKGETFRPGSYALYPSEGKNQEKMMADFVKSMKGKEEVAVTQQPAQQPKEPNQLTAVKEGRMLLDDKGRLCVSRLGEAVPLGLNDQKVKGQTKQQCFKDYQTVQAAVDDVLQQQLNDPNDEALKPKLAALNKAYDLFVKRYGTLHKNTAISFLRNDIDFPSFQALEIYKEEKDIKGKVIVKTSKPKLFTERVIGFKTEPQPKTVKDAVIASIFRTNGIDLEWIATKLSEVAAPPNGGNWTADDVRKGILVSRLGFEDPSTGQLVIRYKYLSGNVREKLAIAEQYNTEGETAGRYAANVEELRKVVPMDIPAHLIDFSLGSSWIPVDLYKDFVKETLDLGNVSIAHFEGSWSFNEGYSFRNEKNRAAGVYSEKFRETIYGHQLVAAALNNRPVKVSKQVTEGYGSSKTTRTVVDQAATQACAVRLDEIKDEFKQWAKKKMQDDPELARRIEKIYNDKFNAMVPMEIGDEFLPEIFDGANQTLPLYGHQKRGVMRGVTAPTMLAHEVGTGKSFTLITTAMEMRRLGTAKKPMIVVQNATVAQMTADAKLLYPNAKVLSLSEQDRDAEGRRAFYAKIKYNDWDIVIVPQSTFERIPDSPERELQFIQEKIDEKKHVIEAAQAAGADERDMKRLRKELEKIEEEYGDIYLDNDPANNQSKKKKKDAKREAASLDKAQTRAKEQLDRATDDVQYFDDLGIDALLVDEAHEYKHLGFQTSIGRGIKGIDPSYSKKCAGLYIKTRSVFEKAGWKNVVFATGTPISNTAAEIWTFMKYLMPADVMKANDIYYFDDFVHNFGNISQMLEFATSGKFKENTRFAAYVNKPELIRIWSQVADTVLTKEVGKVQEKIPEMEGGKDQDVFLPQSPSLIRIMAAVRAELERFENMTGQQKKENSSIPLTMYGIAKRAAIDPRLVDADAPDEPMSKTNAAVKEIVKDLKETESYKGTVAVFCDNQNRLGTNAAGKKVVEFNIYDDMKEKLIKAGVPEKQIAIIKSGMSITAKQKIFDAVNSGEIRVVLGSTQTLGTGVNMQERLHLLIHMDAPDRPMDYTQRNGRIKRQGNLHKQWGKTIRVIRFGVEDSLDVTAYQRLKTKSGFIDSIMDGKASLANNQVDRTVEEEEEGLFDNPVAVLSGSQYALKKNQAERELRKYQGKKAQWEADQVYVANQLRHDANMIEADKATIVKEQKDLERIKGMFPTGTVKTITIEGVKIDMTKDDGAKKLGEAIKEKINDPVNAIVKRNRENAIYNDEILEYTISFDGHDVNFRVDVFRESVYDNGKMKTVIHKYTSYKWPELNIETLPSSRGVRDYLDEILDQVITGRDNQDRIDAMQQNIERLNAEIEQIKKRVGMPFQFDKELEEAQQHVEEYTKLMKQEMEEKEAKYAAQQKEAETDGKGFNLSKAEEQDDEDLYRDDDAWDEQGQPMFRDMDIFAEGERFPIHTTNGYGSYDILDNTVRFSTELMADVYSDQLQMLDAIRRQYPTYYARIEDGHVVMESWQHVMAAADTAARQRNSKQAKAHESYIERKTRNAIKAVNSLAQQMGLSIEVLTTTDGLEGKKARAKGWFNKSTGKITLVLPNHADKSDLINTLLHEGVAHYGLRKMFGPHFDTFLDNVYNNVSPEIKRRIDAAMKRNGWSRQLATEEYLARLAERTYFEHATQQGWWQKIKDFFLRMLTNAGVHMPVPMTDNELRYILWRSYDNLLHPDSRRTLFDIAKDIDMKNRLGINRYVRERERLQRTGRIDTSRIAAEADQLMPYESGGVAEDLNSTDYASDEINAIVDKAKADGTYMLAPNGKPSNLNELQWAQVRTQAFKNWFGDWENDAENASKVVDENGEPKVMYHSTNLNWVNKGEPFWTFYEDSHFGTKGQAEDRQTANEGVKIYEVFLNIRNPQRRADADQDYLDDKDMTMSEYWQLMVARSKSQGYDGIVYLNEYEDKKHPADSWIAFNPNQIKSATENIGDFSTEDNDIRYSIRTKEPPKKTGVGYKVFVLKDGQLYPPMVANPNGEGTPVGVWLDADAAPIAGQSKTGRPQVKAGGKGTQGGSAQLAYRPGWHLGTIPYALQFGRKDANGERTLFPNNFVWAEVEYADDVDYQDEAQREGINASGKYQHSLAGLKHLPTDGSYMYRTNPDPRTDPWVITGAMRVKKILTRDEVDELVRQAGREPQQIQDGDIVTDEAVKELNDEIKATMEADEMGLLYRDDDAWDDEVAPEDEAATVARSIYNDAVRVTGNSTMLSALASAAIHRGEKWEQFKHQFSESWFDYSRSIKVLQDAIEKATGKAVAGFEDVWKSLNAKSSVDSIELQEVMDKYVVPLSEHVGSIIKGKKIDGKAVTIDDVEKYLNAVHGQERNVAMAMKQAQDEYDEDTALLRQQLENASLTDDEHSSIEESLLKKEARFKGIKNYMHYPSIAQWWNNWNQSVERGHNNGTLSDDEYNKVREEMATEYEKGWQYKYRDKDYSGLTALFAEELPEEEEVTEQKLEELASDYAAKFEDTIGKAECEELWDRVKALNNYSLRKSYLSGLISKQQYDDTISMYEHYVPLRGWHDNYAGDVYQYISRGEPAEVLQGVLRKAYGRKSRAARIFGTMAAMANTAIVQGNKNTVAQKLLNLAMNHTDAGLLMVTEQWYRKDANDNLVPEFPNLREDMTAEEMQAEIERFEEDMKDREERGEVEQLRKKFKKEMPLNMAKWQEQRHAVRVLRNGKEYMVYVLGDPRAAEAFNGLLNPHSQPGAISNVLSRYMRFRAKWQTSLSPEFLISNFQRDVMTATTGAYVKFGKETSQQFAKNLAKVMPMATLMDLRKKRNQDLGGIFSLLKKYDNGTLDKDNDMERYFDEFVRNGGMTGISYITRSEEYQASMEDIVKRMRQGKLSKPRQWAEAVGDAVEFANKGIENATRFAMFMTSRQQGKTIVQSIFDAKEASVNFNMKGSGAWGNMMARRLYLYVNPAMQALRMLGTWYENDPMVATKEGAGIVTKAIGKRFMKAAAFTLTASVGTAMLNIMLSALLGHGDDDDDKLSTDWWALSEWNRYNYVNIVNPFGKGYFHWNLPQELRPIWAMGQIAVDGAFGKITPQHGFNAMLSQLNNLTPLSFFEGGTTSDNSTISSIIRTFTPTFVGELTDAYGWNRDFMGHWITNQSSWNEDAPEWQRASEDTPKWLIELSKQWNNIAPNGRENNRSDWESRYLNPSALYYIFTQQYGGIGTMGKRFYQLIEQSVDPEQDVEVRNMPFVPKFYVSTGDDYSQNRVMNEKFRMYWDEYKAADGELSRDRKAVKDGAMSQEDADRTIEERKADGSYQTWKAIHDNYLDKLYQETRGTKNANEVKQMVVDAVEQGKVPDFTNQEGKIYENAIKRQKTSQIDDMTDEEMRSAFDNSKDNQMRSMIAKRIATSAGASKDAYGEKSSADFVNIYQELRTANDVYEDALLLSYYEQAKEEGNDNLKDQIKIERELLRQYAKELSRDYPEDNKDVMKEIRQERSNLIRRLHNIGVGNR